MRNINDALYDLYYSTNEKIYKYITDKNSTLKTVQVGYPLYLKLNQEYINSKNKIIFYGQETNGWHDEFTGRSIYNMQENKIEGILETYQKFFNEKGYYNYNPSPFWNIFRLFNDLCCECDKEFALLWNNITKIDLNGGGFPYNWYDDLIKPYLNELIIKELEIIEPDFLVFFTGRDSIIDDIFNNPKRKEVEGFNQDDLCELIIPNIKKAFRTHHPKTLYLNSQNGSYKEIILKMHHYIYEEMK
jgi:hypothetical protein